MMTIALAIGCCIFGFVFGVLARHSLADHRFTTFDGGKNWFRDSDTSNQVHRMELSGALRALTTELTSRRSVKIEVRL